ncbi:MAG: DUF1501 domain-containing protein [Deltaproteobacteria bacterium]
MKHKNISRRDFLINLGKAGIGAGILSQFMGYRSFANPLLFNNLLNDDYKVLVCFFQTGGNDSYNMLIPLGSEYNQYQLTRSNLAIPEDQILKINPLNTGNRQFGLHPAMPEIQTLFENGDLSFISNIGTLIQYVDADQVRNNSAPVPLGLFSHVDQQQEWMTGKPHERDIRGWGGKIADHLNDMNPPDSISMNISLSGTNIFQVGDNTVEFSIGYNESEVGITGYENESWDGFDEAITKGIDRMLNQNHTDPFKKTYIDVIKSSRDGIKIYKNAMEETSELTTQFSENDVSRAFRIVSKLIKANNILGFKRQIYFIEYGTWDHHDELLNNQNEMLREVSVAFSEFNNAMKVINMNDNVTLFSMSEFARTLTSNGNGTDHAWGGNVMVMGGGVRGKRIFGDYPTLDLGNELILWDGIVVPTLATDEYFTELAQWFGIQNSMIPQLFPNINNFYNLNSGTPPIGFMKS